MRVRPIALLAVFILCVIASMLPALARAADIDQFDDKIMIRPFVQYPISQLQIRNYDNSLDAVSSDTLTNLTTYQPNVNFNVGLGVGYKWFGLSYQMAVTGTARDEADYGRSEYIDFQFYFVFKKFGVDLFFQRYSGYYLVNPIRLDNPQDYNVTKGDAHVKRSDLKLTSIGLNGYYIFNDNFSFKAAFKQTERQNTSAGSFMLMASAINYGIEAEHSLIPPSQEVFYGENAGFSRGMFTALCVLPGYAYTFVFPNHVFITPAGFIGAGGMIKNYHVTSGDKGETDFCWKFNVRIGAGYNGDTYFYGITAMYDRTDSQGFVSKGGISVAVAVGQIEAYAGVRF
ncbi:MAG TPA: DUF4421 family protein [Spirochaetota bacterium]|nr:DUF4421 family protein [Spirochaetota bacterium]HOS41697.1 DUF4421 family protein [Spirochaetota bacterium]HPU86980.1 DUF4421 family protein [Spirochaetota bacterium]